MHPNEYIVRELFRAIEQRDFDGVAAWLHPDVEFVWPPSLPGYGGVHRRADLPAMLAAFMAAWAPRQTTEETRRLRPEILGSRGNEVVVYYHQRGSHRGRTCDAEVIGRYRFLDGKVIRLQMFYFDPEAVTAFLRDTPAGAP